MSSESKMLGQIENKSQLQKEVSVSTALLVLCGSAVGAYVGLQIGGPIGAAVGTLVGAFVGALAAGFVKNFRVKVHKDGWVEVKYETRFA